MNLALQICGVYEQFYLAALVCFLLDGTAITPEICEMRYENTCSLIHLVAYRFFGILRHGSRELRATTEGHLAA
jgi:hypothetical protein